ncbi:MAG: hypothetical protein WD114_00815 [Phycisphaerales bacterium]
MNHTSTTTNNQPEPVLLQASDDAGVIPFADESAASRAEIAGPRQDSARDAFGEPVAHTPVSASQSSGPPSVVDRDLGLSPSALPAGQGRYTCPCCKQGARRVVRVRLMSQPGWTAVCAVCAAALLERVPGTIVGGMVRPTRRRSKSRPVQPGQLAHGFRRNDQGGYRRAG